MSFPKKLNLEHYFSSPVWWADETKFIKKLNKASDKYIKDAQKRLKKELINIQEKQQLLQIHQNIKPLLVKYFSLMLTEVFRFFHYKM